MLSRVRAANTLSSRVMKSFGAIARFSTAAPEKVVIDKDMSQDELRKFIKSHTIVNPDASITDDKFAQIVEENSNSYTVAETQYSIFNPDPQLTVSKRLVGPFGTMESPTKVFSPKPYRIVGCVGPHDNDHELMWFSMEGYLKHMCPHCGQIFQLTTNPDEVCTDYIPKVDNMAHF